MEDKTNICNIMPSPFDARDWQYEGLVLKSENQPKLPKKFLCNHLRPVKDQKQRGTCVAMTLSCVKEYQETIDNHKLANVLFSPESVYYYRQPEEGMYPRNAMKILKEKGMCLENTFPYFQYKDPSKIPKRAVEEASYFILKSYARVNTQNGAKSSLLNYGPLLIAFPYYNNGLPEFWRKIDADTKMGGGHAVAIVGWNSDGFILRNSWGKKWNGDGHVIYPYSDWGSHWEIWSCVDLESNYMPDLPKTLCEILCCK